MVIETSAHRTAVSIKPNSLYDRSVPIALPFGTDS